MIYLIFTKRMGYEIQFGDKVSLVIDGVRKTGVVVGFTGMRNSDEQGYIIILKPYYSTPVKHNVKVLESCMGDKVVAKESDMQPS